MNMAVRNVGNVKVDAGTRSLLSDGGPLASVQAGDELVRLFYPRQNLRVYASSSQLLGLGLDKLLWTLREFVKLSC